ncbi:MAG TPA: type II/IV secretion system protein [Thermoanaerobaculia bacterium]|jgi:type II secretory ATPase GspE/PulE/Tfp pilus assembly ATPase PilB-like protein|nr:type II/IV secretion system protein [Thermoanaerobaculia bacterium]
MATEPNPEFTELAQFVIDERSVRMLEREYCLENDVVVLGLVDRTQRDPVTVGMLDPSRRALVHEVAKTLGRPVKAVRLNAWEIRHALDRGHGIVEEDRARLTLRPIRDISFERDGEVPEILDEILGRAVELRASDVHVETYEEDVDVRFRIDGMLRQVATPLSRDNIQGVVNRLKVLSGLDVAERRRAQDGRIQATFQAARNDCREVDFRLSVVPGPFGEDAVLRILDSAAPLPLEKLGLDDAELATFERLIQNPEGLLLVTGPTGSGKTTTLYAALHRINSPENKILTVEDPIEYHFPKTNQKQVSVNMGFADYARAFMRQNPDIILIGEIRDEDTASAAVRAAQTGHLVLSTLHTTDAVRTISRLLTLGVDPGLIAGCLLGAMSQRLVRKLCPQCRVEAAPGSSEAQRLGVDGLFYRAQGCPACDGAGYKGRIGIYELFVLDSELADLVAEKAPVHQIRSAALDKGMKTLFDDAVRKARLGLTSLEEILRTVPYRILEGR